MEENLMETSLSKANKKEEPEEQFMRTYEEATKSLNDFLTKMEVVRGLSGKYQHTLPAKDQEFLSKLGMVENMLRPLETMRSRLRIKDL
jgi:hypothetical protein